MTEFDFGKGPVSAHRHLNGGGWVADTAIVEDTTYVGPNAWVSENARVSSGFAVSNTSINIIEAQCSNNELQLYASPRFATSVSAIDSDTQIVRNYDKLDAQLNILSADFSEDFGRCLDQASVAGLRKFLQMHQEVALPTSISADQDGKLEATWRSADSQSASFKFVDQEKFHYALLVETAAGRKRPWGTSSRSEIFLARPEARTILGRQLGKVMNEEQT